MKNFILSLQFIFKPSYWTMVHPYSKIWDEKLNELLDKYEFTDIEYSTAKLGNNLIWIANQKYGCMTLYSDSYKYKFRPSRLTIKRGLKKLNKSIETEKNKSFKIELDKINKII